MMMKYMFSTSVNSTFRTEFEHNDAAQLTPRTHAVASVSLPSGVAYGQKIVKSLHAGPKHQIWYMHSSGQYKRFWRGVPEFRGQGQGQVKVKGQNGVVFSLLLYIWSCLNRKSIFLFALAKYA